MRKSKKKIYIYICDGKKKKWHLIRYLYRKLQESLQKLSRLRILEQKEQVLVMNETFRNEFKNALTGG